MFVLPSGLAFIRSILAAIFTPTGGNTAGTQVQLTGNGGPNASVTISCNQPAVWRYTYTSGSNASADISSGATATSITFSSYNGTTNPVVDNFTCNATAAGVTQYWRVTLNNTGFA
jgi:Tfp pilus assembly protein FimT